MKVISGCQNGVDQAALFAAEKLGIETGGWIPKGCKTLDGPRFDLRDRFKLQEHSSSNYADRTADNVASSDGTLRIAADFKSAGERCTKKAIDNHCKPYLDIQVLPVWGPNKVFYGYEIITFITSDDVVQWLLDNKISVLNVAGNAEQTAPGIQKYAQSILERVFEKWKLAQSLSSSQS